MVESEIRSEKKKYHNIYHVFKIIFLMEYTDMLTYFNHVLTVSNYSVR